MAGVAPHVLIDADHGDTLEPGGVGDERPAKNTPWRVA